MRCHFMRVFYVMIKTDFSVYSMLTNFFSNSVIPLYYNKFQNAEITQQNTRIEKLLALSMSFLIIFENFENLIVKTNDDLK